MKLLKNLSSKVIIHPSTVIYFCLSYFTGYFQFYLITYLIVCFHEICHFLMAYSFRFEINKIELLPFGLYIYLDDYGFKPKIIDSLVVLAGLISHYFIYIINELLICSCFINEMNKTIFVFNLLPIFPLDGYRLLLIIIENLIDIKASMYFMSKLSILILCLLFVSCDSIGNYILFGYLLYMNVVNYYTIDDFLRRYYLKIPYDYSNNKIRIHSRFKYLRDYENYYLINSKIYTSKDIKFDLLKSTKRIQK